MSATTPRGAFARHLPPSAAVPRVLALDPSTAGELAGAAEVSLSAAPEGGYDAVAGRRLATAGEVAALAQHLRPGGRLILAAAAEPETLLSALTGAGLIHCLVETTGGLTLYRGERPPAENSNVARGTGVQVMPPSHAAGPANAPTGGQALPRYLFLLVTQTPNKPAWKLAPEERVEWRAATVMTTEGRRLLAFSALVKAVAYMQPAVLAGAIVGVNKVAKFPTAAAEGWGLPYVLNPSFDELRDAAPGPPLPVAPETAITGEE